MSTYLRIWGSGVRISSGAPLRYKFANQRVCSWAGINTLVQNQCRAERAVHIIVDGCAVMIEVTDAWQVTVSASPI